MSDADFSTGEVREGLCSEGKNEGAELGSEPQGQLDAGQEGVVADWVVDEDLVRRGRSEFCEQRHSKIHGTGVFATKDIAEDARIIEYVGEKLEKEESHRRGWEQMARGQETGGPSVLIFTLDEEYDIDGDYAFNTARLINHSCAPNCYSQVIDGRIWVLAARDIEAGEELCFNYGFNLDHWREHPCRCGAEDCIGYIVGFEYWEELREILAGEAEAAAEANGEDVLEDDGV